MNTILHVVCAWCQKVMVEGDKTQPTSHGMCSVCVERFQKEIA